MFKRLPFFTLLAAPLLMLALPVQAALRIFACEPEWGALAKELGGSLVEVSVATSALQDPHQIQAKPSLIARARNADLLVCTGAELEIGWLPLLLQQSGNPKVQAGQAGNFAAADAVRKLDVPGQLDRSQGDVHAHWAPAFAGVTVFGHLKFPPTLPKTYCEADASLVGQRVQASRVNPRTPDESMH